MGRAMPFLRQHFKKSLVRAKFATFGACGARRRAVFMGGSPEHPLLITDSPDLFRITLCDYHTCDDIFQIVSPRKTYLLPRPRAFAASVLFAERTSTEHFTIVSRSSFLMTPTFPTTSSLTDNADLCCFVHTPQRTVFRDYVRSMTRSRICYKNSPTNTAKSTM